mmetsp:Transcript_54294/g.137956  ORF Transcript_54294/g.137956 Transcript_54294/m.137956 type:complete len:348 (-) Transcript_54294:181-1224(-)
MAADHWHVDLIHRHSCQLVHELVRAHNVQARDPADLPRVQACLLVELAHGWHHGVHRVHDQPEDGIRAELRARLHDVLGDACVHAQEIRPRHTRLPGHASRNEHEVAARQALLQLVHGLVVLVQGIARDLALSLQVRQVRGDARCRHHRQGEVEDAELAHVRVLCHKHAQRLANAASTAADANFEVARGIARSRRGLVCRRCAWLGNHGHSMRSLHAAELHRAGIGDPSINLFLQLSETLLESLLLVRVHRSKCMRLLDALLTECDLRGHVGQLLPSAPDHIRALRGLDASEAAQDCVAELGARVSHGECGAALAVLGIHHICAGILHVLVQGRNLFSAQGLRCGDL